MIANASTAPHRRLCERWSRPWIHRVRARHGRCVDRPSHRTRPWRIGRGIVCRVSRGRGSGDRYRAGMHALSQAGAPVTLARAVTPEGVKAHQRSGDAEDRALPYRNYRRTFAERCATTGSGLHVNDIDQLEWRMIDGRPVPVAVFELTCLDRTVTVVRPQYLAAILDRMQLRDPQAALACEVARRCGVEAWVIAWRIDCSEFWIFNLSINAGWWHLTAPEYRRWIVNLEGDTCRARSRG